MRKWILGVCAVGFLVPTGAGVASAGTMHGEHSATVSFPSGCTKVAFTASGGYYSAGHFYPLPSDTVTVHAKWCYSTDVITSYKVTWTTTIPTTEQPRITKLDSLNGSGSVLTISLNGDFLSGVVNNIGFIGIDGRVSALGHHRFTNVSGSGG